MNKIHLDTDLGGDLDDLCALAMLLRWPGEVQFTGITVVGDTQGKRTGSVRYVLGLAGRNDIPVAAGADTSQGFYPYPLGLPPEERYWPEAIIPSPNAPEEAIHLLKQSVEQGATIIGIGPYTNLYLLELQYPGILREAKLFLMGGYIYPPRPGFPQWGNHDDFNIQVDVRSAKHLLENATPTLIPLSVTAETSLRRKDLDRLRNADWPVARLIAKQAEEFALDEKMEVKYGATCERVATDIINFQHDGLACAIALGWNEGVTIEEIPLCIEEEVTEDQRWLVERIDASGRPFRVVTKVDGERFGDFWLNTVAGERAISPR